MTDVERRIRADELGTYLRGKMGLVVGPGVTINPGIMAELSSHLASEFGVERRDSFLETGERCLEGSVPEDGLRDRIRQFFAAQKAAPGLAQLAKARSRRGFSRSRSTHSWRTSSNERPNGDFRVTPSRCSITAGSRLPLDRRRSSSCSGGPIGTRSLIRTPTMRCDELRGGGARSGIMPIFRMTRKGPPTRPPHSPDDK